MFSNRYAQVKLDNFPIIESKTFAVDPTLEEIEDFFVFIEKITSDSTESYVFINNSEGVTYISPEARVLISKKSEYLSNKLKHRELGVFLVVDNLIGRILLRTMSSFYKPLANIVICDSMQEAYTKAKLLLNS